MLALHAAPGPVVDTTWGKGAMWTRALLERYRPTRLDYFDDKAPDGRCEWKDLPTRFPPAAFLTALWDPPMLNDAGNGLVGGNGWDDCYGTLAPGLRGQDSIVPLMAPFLDAVRPILDPRRGTLLVKLADQVHSGPLQWQPFHLWRIALEHGWLPCDYQIRKRAQLEPNAKTQRHVRRKATFWLALHTGHRCPNPGLPLVRSCAGCGEVFKPRRRNQFTCSDRCRQRLHRRKERV